VTCPSGKEASVDPIVLAAERVVGYLVPIALGKATELAQKVGKNAVEKISNWLDRLRARWVGDAEADAALKKFEADPEENSEVLRDVLAERMRREDALKDDAEQLSKDVGPLVVVTMEAGRVELQEGPEFGDVLRGKVNVGMKATEAGVQRGPKFGNIG
jgi:hypothetical protein